MTPTCPGCKTGYYGACPYCKANRFLPNEIFMHTKTWDWLLKNLPKEWFGWRGK